MEPNSFPSDRRSVTEEPAGTVNAESSEVSSVIERLHAEQAGMLRRLAWAIVRDWQLADDATQEAFLLLSQRFAEVPAERRVGWLVRTVQLQAKNLRRKHARQMPLDESLAGLVGSASSPGNVGRESQPPHRNLEDAEEQARLAEAIAQLPTEQRLVVLARLADEKTFAQIAEQQGVSIGTVLSRMRLALKKLRDTCRPD